MKNLFIITMLSMIFLLSCNETDKQKLQLIYNIMENSDKIDSLVMSSNFYNDEVYSKFQSNLERKNEIINYIQEYNNFGYDYITDKKLNVKKMNSEEYDKCHYFKVGFRGQKIGCTFIFKFDKLQNKWFFLSVGAAVNNDRFY